MAPVWADRESASCALNTIKHASGYSDETLCLFCSILLARLKHAICTHYRATLLKPFPLHVSNIVPSYPPQDSLASGGGSASPDPPIGNFNTPRVDGNLWNSSNVVSHLRPEPTRTNHAGSLYTALSRTIHQDYQLQSFTMFVLLLYTRSFFRTRQCKQAYGDDRANRLFFWHHDQ